MLNWKKWFTVFAMFLFGLALEFVTPEDSVRSAAASVQPVALGEQTEAVKVENNVVNTEDIWRQAYRKLMYETEVSGQKLAVLALAEVKGYDLQLMSNSTDHIVNYHGRRFAITDEDYQVLLKIVQAEAGGEDIKGKMLVANVVLNRLEIGFGGDTITEVVFDEGQFSPVSSGRIFKVTPSEETIEAVERVLNGEDESRGALYFMCRELASKQGIRWFDNNLKFLFKHGCHEFFVEKD